MSEAAAFLSLQAENLKHTAKRCTDPVIVAELEQIIEELLSEADRLNSR